MGKLFIKIILIFIALIMTPQNAEAFIGLENPNTLNEVSYKVKNSPIVPEKDDRQRLIQTSNNIFYLKIKRDFINEKFNYPVQLKGFEQYLKVEQVIPDAKDELSYNLKNIDDAYELIEKALNWVNNKIVTDKNSTLLSVLRSFGIPAKLVGGFSYNEEEKTFKQAVWLKAYVGRWINVSLIKSGRGFSPLCIFFKEYENVSEDDIIVDLEKLTKGIELEIIDKKYSKTNYHDDLEGSGEDESTGKALGIVALLTQSGKKLKKNENTQASSQGYLISLNEGIKKFMQGDVEGSYEELKVLASQERDDNNFIDMSCAETLAMLGFFDLSNELMNGLKDKEIWGRKINEIKRLYFPKSSLSKKNQQCLAKSLSQIEFSPEADVEIEKILSKELFFEKNDYAHYILSKGYEKQTRLKEALKEINKAISLNTDNVRYRLHRAKLNSRLKNYWVAYRDIKFIKKNNATAKKIIKTANLENARNDMKRFRKNSYKYRYNEALYNYLANNNKKALTIIDRAITDYPKKTVLYRLRGDIYFKQKYYINATKDYLTALRLNKNDAHSIEKLGDISYIRGDVSFAIEYYNRAKSINPKSAATYMKLADSYKIQGMHQQAKDFYLKALSLDESNDTCLNRLADRYFEEDELEEAQKLYKKALSYNPRNALSWLGLTKIELQKGNTINAEKKLFPVNFIDETKYNYYKKMITDLNANY